MLDILHIYDMKTSERNPFPSSSTITIACVNFRSKDSFLNMAAGANEEVQIVIIDCFIFRVSYAFNWLPFVFVVNMHIFRPVIEWDMMRDSHFSPPRSTCCKFFFPSLFELRCYDEILVIYFYIFNKIFC